MCGGSSMRWVRLFSLLALGIQSVRGFLWICNEAQCGRPDTQPVSARIVGGHEARPGSLPWMAMVNWCNYMTCGGAILNSRFVITAAHCFDQPLFPCFDLSKVSSTEPSHTANYTVYVGKLNVLRSNEGERRMEVEKIIVHPGYDNRTQQNDVALIKLKTAIQYSSLIKPLCLPSPHSSATLPSVGQPCIVAGYGQTLGFETYSLHQVTVPVVSDQQCSQPDWYGHTIHPPDQFCAGFETGGMDACSGDSGSPLICNFHGVWYASGIVSRGEGCAEPKKPGVYANMSHHSAWVLSAMRENGYVSFCP